MFGKIHTSLSSRLIQQQYMSLWSLRHKSHAAAARAKAMGYACRIADERNVKEELRFHMAELDADVYI